MWKYPNEVLKRVGGKGCHVIETTEGPSRERFGGQRCDCIRPAIKLFCSDLNPVLVIS